MADTLSLNFAAVPQRLSGVTVLLAEMDGKLGTTAARLAGEAGLSAYLAPSDSFSGKAGTVLDLVGPNGVVADRVIMIGLGDGAKCHETDWIKLGGCIIARLPDAATEAQVVLDTTQGLTARQAALVALGARLRFYDFDRYKTKKKDGDKGPRHRSLTLCVSDAKAARSAFKALEAVADGVDFARDLVNEPPNMLFPAEFARRAADLKRLGVKVEILGEKDLQGLKMGALLAVGQGSRRESQVVVMRWNGGSKGEPPLALVGKGVCFDSGGISIKPSENMQDMKGDMGGAAAVCGTMQALAARKAKANVVGIIGLVENMPDGNAYRPGDILTSMNGQTIEIVNTDAEGRLVLADILHYARTRFEPKAMINLATLTGAIMVALGTEHAGLFANNDDLAGQLTKAGLETGEKVWRMPMNADYDKLIDSQFADMKNSGGRLGGSITAAQFLQRFVGDTPWAHLDVAGTAMGAKANDINRSWGPGWGVRLLDRFVQDQFEQ